jgi:molybdopterin converting factor small subunit
VARGARLHDGHRWLLSSTEARRTVRVRVLTFARLREVLGYGERELEIAVPATLEDVWTTVTAGWNEAAAMRPSTRFARNGAIAGGETRVADGDEIALLPPVGGG